MRYDLSKKKTQSLVTYKNFRRVTSWFPQAIFQVKPLCYRATIVRFAQNKSLGKIRRVFVCPVLIYSVKKTNIEEGEHSEEVLYVG